jgi:hypothetical protein
MKNFPNCNVELNGAKGEIFVSDNHEGRYMCVFVKTPAVDFCNIYNAYGFMVWTPDATLSETKYFPIKLTEDTKLTPDIMVEMWKQIEKQIAQYNH